MVLRKMFHCSVCNRCLMYDLVISMILWHISTYVKTIYDVTMNWQLECGLTGVRALNAMFFFAHGSLLREFSRCLKKSPCRSTVVLPKVEHHQFFGVPMINHPPCWLLIAHFIFSTQTPLLIAGTNVQQPRFNLVLKCSEDFTLTHFYVSGLVAQTHVEQAWWTCFFNAFDIPAYALNSRTTNNSL